tara:strand:- start:227 stop:484 length:258 start_codon:yes stop_codon:yes gene_type:complete
MEQKQEYVSALRKFIIDELLDGQGEDLDESTPLLELGVLGSLEVVRLRVFVNESFNISIPIEKLEADSFTNLSVLSEMLCTLNPS